MKSYPTGVLQNFAPPPYVDARPVPESNWYMFAPYADAQQVQQWAEQTPGMIGIEIVDGSEYYPQYLYRDPNQDVQMWMLKAVAKDDQGYFIVWCFAGDIFDRDTNPNPGDAPQPHKLQVVRYSGLFGGVTWVPA